MGRLRSMYSATYPEKAEKNNVQEAFQKKQYYCVRSRWWRGEVLRVLNPRKCFIYKHLGGFRRLLQPGVILQKSITKLMPNPWKIIPKPSKNRTMDLVSGNWILEARNWRPESGNWTLEARKWRLEAGRWSQEAGKRASEHNPGSEAGSPHRLAREAPEGAGPNILIDIYIYKFITKVATVLPYLQRGALTDLLVG